MITPIDLDNFVKIASEAYLKNNTPLNDTIVKIATENGLTREQINRVIEGSNTDVYLQLFNKSDDKYVTFETADREKIYDHLSPENKVAEVANPMDDYTEPPTEEHETIKVGVSIFPEISEDSHIYQDELLRSYYKLAAVNTRLEETMTEKDLAFQQEVSKFQEMIKQAVLGGTAYSDIYNAIITAHENDPIISAVLSDTETFLKEKTYNVKLEKSASKNTAVNLQHPLLIQSGKLVKIASEYKMLQDKLHEVAEEWENLKTAETKTKVLKGLTAPWKHPGIFLSGGALGVAGGATVAAIAEKNQREQESSPLHKIPEGYRQ